MFANKTMPTPSPGIIAPALTPTVEVTTTVTVGGRTETFTASGNTDGSPWNTARALLAAVENDGSSWTYKMERESR